MNYMNSLSITLNLVLMEEKQSQLTVYAPALNVIRVRGVKTGKNLCGEVLV
jgi:hypothetical protein